MPEEQWKQRNSEKKRARRCLKAAGGRFCSGVPGTLFQSISNHAECNFQTTGIMKMNFSKKLGKMPKIKERNRRMCISIRDISKIKKAYSKDERPEMCFRRKTLYYDDVQKKQRKQNYNRFC